MKKVLVTGSSGFLGKIICQRLVKAGFEIMPFNLSAGLSVLKASDWGKAPTVDVVIHLAGRTFVPESFNEPERFYEENILGTLNVLKYCRERPVKKIIFANTYVYGEPQYVPVDEKHPVSVISPYNRSKYLAEQLIEGYCRDFGLSAVLLRIFNVYGPGQDVRFVIPKLVHQMMSDAPEIVLDNLKPQRDFVYIDDVAQAFCRACEVPVTGAQVINIGSGRAYSIGEVLKVLEKVSGREKRIVSKNITRPGEITKTLACIDKAKEILDWSPQINLEDGLREMVERTHQQVELRK